ncbi:MAG: type II secretion system secretin GspD [Pseudomonadota bacterium]
MKRSTPRLAPLLLLLCAAMVFAQTTPPRTGSFTPSFQNVDITVVADAVGAATGITFLPDPRARANVSLNLPAGARPLSAQQFYAMFLSMLGQNGFVAVPAGNNTMKIVPQGEARTMPGNDLPTGSNLAADEIVTDVLETKNINGLQVSQVLRTFISPAGQIAPVPGTNSMVITDRAGNVARLKRILARVDQSSNSDFQIIPLENAVASELTTMLGTLLTPQASEAGAGGVAARVQADGRTNSLIVSGDPAQRLRISALASELDAPVSNGGGTQVYSLKYATATDLATTLNAQVTGQAATTGGGGGGGAAGAAAPSASAIADRSVKIIAHEATNQLIITAPTRQMAAIAKIIESLDIPPDQVHIEAIVAEISDRQAADLGVNWAIFSTDGNTNVPISGFISPIAGASIGEVAGTVVDVESAIGAGALPQGATFGIGRLRDTGISFAAMLRALRTDGNTNIVSLPNVTATNNQEAEMKSGQEVPFLSGQYTNTGGGGGGGNNGSVNPFSTVQRKSVGTNLKVTPQIIAGNGEVILKIELTSSELSGKSGDGGSLITNERSVKTMVRVRTGSTIVIGGMIKNGTDESVTRVPLLSKIPILGELFKTRTGTREKTNMMVFIQPRILRDAVDANAETSTRYNALRDAESKMNTRKDKEIIPLLPKQNSSLLPDIGPPPPAVTPTAPAPGTP